MFGVVTGRVLCRSFDSGASFAIVIQCKFHRQHLPLSAVLALQKLATRVPAGVSGPRTKFNMEEYVWKRVSLFYRRFLATASHDLFLMRLGCFLRRSGAPPCLMSFDLASADDGPDNFQPDCLHGQM